MRSYFFPTQTTNATSICDLATPMTSFFSYLDLFMRRIRCVRPLHRRCRPAILSGSFMSFMHTEFKFNDDDVSDDITSEES